MENNKQDKKQKDLKNRPPIVVVLGHVDHGKSSILEAIKDLKITSKESGGITQHIGAYEVEHNGKKITFIDTPGHEAFSAMRSRGAKVADIAVLVVAAEDGVKPQTKEAISYIKKAGILQVVAINKMDKPEADPERVKRELVKEEVLVESMGGKIPVAQVSAKTKKGIPELLDLILLVAEMEDLKADWAASPEGVVVESYLDSFRGPTATLLVRQGILGCGVIIGTASAYGKVKALEDFQGNSIEKAFPSMPCIVLGFQDVPGVGEKFQIFETPEAAQEYIQAKQRKSQDREVIVSDPSAKVLNLIVKADVAGSLEAIEGIIKSLPQEKVSLRILKSGVGEITEEDVKLARGSSGKIIGFRVKANATARKWAEQQNINIITFDVIYDLSQAVRNLMEKYLEPEVERKDLGRIKVLVIFRTEKNRQIIGGKVIEGEIRKGTKIEVIRGGGDGEESVGKGRLIGLQKEKKDVDKVLKGQECGILYEGDIKIEEGDILQIYIEEKRKGEL